MNDFITVVAAVIEKNGSYLIARRSAPEHLKHKWEFPGGKVKKEESPQTALQREMFEEFGITVDVGPLLSSTTYDYPEFRIRLLAYKTKHIAGKFSLSDHECIKWIKSNECNDYEFVPADIPILERLIGNNNSNHP